MSADNCGAVALAAASRCRRVVAVDPSAAMARALKRTIVDRGITNLEVVPRGFLTYEHRGSLANFVFSRNALHHLPDFWTCSRSNWDGGRPPSRVGSDRERRDPRMVGPRRS